MQSISVFLDVTKFANFCWKNADVSRTQSVCHVIYMLFGSSLGKVYNCQVPKKPILNRVKIVFMLFYSMENVLFYVKGHSMSKIYGKHWWMRIIATQVSDLCIKTFPIICPFARSYTINSACIFSRDYPYWFWANLFFLMSFLIV